VPPDLAALLVQEGALAAEDLERALARQRDAGGALDTALLELGLVREADLVGALSRASGLPRAPGRVEPDARARRVFPARVAERHGLAPFRLEGRELLVLATYPVDVAVLDEISFMLSLDIAPHVAPEWRVREVMARTYGLELAPRFAQLAERLGGVGDDATSTATDLEDPDLDFEIVTIEEELAAPSVPESRRPPEDEPPWTRESALAALEAADTRDDVVAVALRSARAFFEAAAFLAVTRNQVTGLDAQGWDGARERCVQLHLVLGAEGVLRRAVEASGPHLGPVARVPDNEALLEALGRRWPRVTLVYPVAIRGRIACILYADNGEAPVSAGRLGDLLLVAGALGPAFERIVLETKRLRAIAPPLGQSVSRDGGGAAVPPDEANGGTWQLRETARFPQEDVAPAPAEAATAPPDAFEVGPASAALALPVLDAGAAVHRLRASRRGSAQRTLLVEQLVAKGPEAAAALSAAFPGPLEVGQAGAPVEERGPVLAALAALGIVATPYLVELLRDASTERRRLAAQLLGRTGDPAAFLPLAERALDADRAAADAALDALARHRGHQDFRPVLERLRRELLGGDGELAGRAARSLARLGDGHAVPLLIQAIEGADPLGAAAVAALEALTCRRHGRDAGRWIGWWKEHGARPRLEWLLEALEDDEREVRVAAAEALREGAAPPVPWDPDAAPTQRAELARAWRAACDAERTSAR
jgi:hypothetical protein